MTLVVLVGLAILWAVVLIPPYLRNRSESSPADSIGAFRRQLSVLERTTPGGSAAPLSASGGLAPQQHSLAPQQHNGFAAGQFGARLGHAVANGDAPVTGVRATVPLGMPSRREVRKRRRDVLVGLLATAGITLVLGAVPALRTLWLVHVVVDVLLVAYVVMLIRLRNLAAERDMKVRFLPGPEPALAFDRRSGTLG